MAKRLVIMKDSQIGTYGVIALVLSLLLRWYVITQMIEKGVLLGAVLTAAVMSRGAMVWVMHRLPHARRDGLAQSTGRPGRAATYTALGLAALSGTASFAEVKIGFIGSMSSDTGLSTLRGATIAIEELNAAGGMNGEQIVLVTADTSEDVTEGVKAYEYLAETEEVDFIISGSIDDVSLGWLPRMQEFQIPTLDTWTSYIGIIDMIIEDPETMAPYFMNIASDEALATLYINFGADVLKKKMGWDSVVILAEDTAFGGAITGLVTDALGPVAGIEVKEIITYDVNTNDFAPLFSKAALP